jgi:hypothetical protein
MTLPNNWKTTLLGVASILSTAAAFLAAGAKQDYVTAMNTLPALFSAIGLFFAKDHNR